MSFFKVINENIELIKLGFTIIGGGFALYQWRIQIKLKRADIVKELIHNIRGDKDIADTMDMIDWPSNFTYDSKFHLSESAKKIYKCEYTDQELFVKIDKTLAHFSYICYLLNNQTLSRKKERIIFEYELRRICDNEHISNYLFSLYHWSKYRNVRCSYSYLIEYAIENKYLDKDFKSINSRHYKCHLYLYESISAKKQPKKKKDKKRKC